MSYEFVCNTCAYIMNYAAIDEFALSERERATIMAGIELLGTVTVEIQSVDLIRATHCMCCDEYLCETAHKIVR